MKLPELIKKLQEIQKNHIPYKKEYELDGVVKPDGGSGKAHIVECKYDEGRDDVGLYIGEWEEE